MSGTIDQRVVSMKFDGDDAKVQNAVKGLTALSEKIKGLGAAGGDVKNLDAAVNKVGFANLATAIDDVKNRFSVMGQVAIGVLTNIANRAIGLGTNLAKQFTIDPVISGLREYETQLNSVQTILANTASKGGNLKTVNAALNELNHYADKTIYNFTEMTRNIGTFTAAGVDLKTSTAAIKGIANLAAVSGSNAQQASTAMYQLSQALATGTVKLIDWNSVVNAGMGGQVFQDAIKETARAHGVAVDKIIKDEGSFRDSLQKGWLTSEIMTETLSKFTGDLTASQLKTMGYNEKQIAGILKMGKTAQDAATKVKTMTQLMDTLREASQSGWAQSWQIVSGDFEEAKAMYTDVSNVLGKMIGDSADARNKMLGDWKKLGGRKDLIDAISNAFHGVMSVLKPINKAFRDIFPPTTGAQLKAMTVGLKEFTEKLKMGAKDSENLRRTFRGVFALFSIAGQLLSGFGKILASVVEEISDASGGFLDFTGGIGDWLVNLDKAAKSGQGLTVFFDGLAKAVKTPIRLVQTFVNLIKQLAAGIPAVDIQDFLADLWWANSPLTDAVGLVEKPLKVVQTAFSAFWLAVQPAVQSIGNAFAELGQILGGAVSDISIDNLASVFTTLFTGSTLLVLRKFVKTVTNGFESVDGIFENLGSVFDLLTSHLQAMTQNVKAGTLLKIAAAVGLLALSMVALSSISPDKLGVALGGLAGAFAELSAFMLVINKFAGLGMMAKLPVISFALIELSFAISGLVSSVLRLSGLSWEELAKGLVGVGGILLGIALFTKFATVNKNAVLATAGLLNLAIAIKILATVVEDFAALNVADIVKGILSITVLLGVVGLFMKLTQGSAMSVASSVGLVIVAAALKVLASAVGDFGALNIETLAKGLISMAIGLGIVALAMSLMPPTMLVSAIGLVIVAAALKVLASALSDMGGMTWEGIAKGLVTLTLSLVILAGGLYLMTAALPGAAALAVAAASLALLAPVLLAFGNMSWENIAKGLVMLAGVFVVIGLAGLVLTPVVPTLILLGYAIVLLGAGMMTAGAGMMWFATGLATLAASGLLASNALAATAKMMIGLLPELGTHLAESFTNMIETFAKNSERLANALVKMLESMLSAGERIIPKIVEFGLKLVLKLVEALEKKIPRVVQSGMKLLIGILDGIQKHIGKVVDKGTLIVTNFLDGVSRNLPKVTKAASNLVITFVNDLAKRIREDAPKLRAAARNLGDAIIDGMTGGISGGLGDVISAARRVATSALNAAKRALGIASPSKEFEELGEYSDEGLVIGFDKNAGAVSKSAVAVVTNAYENVKKAIANSGSLLDVAGIDSHPEIRPVLNLTDVINQANGISGIFGRTAIPVETAYSEASDIYNDTQPKTGSTEQVGQDTTTSVVFNQYNNSPKALSAPEIYRQTRNQLSMIRKGLPV